MSRAFSLALTLFASLPAFAGVDEAPFLRFSTWAREYRAAGSDFERTRLEAEGVALAKARRPLLKELMRTEPQQALRRFESRLGLPPAVAEHLELPVDALGRYEVLCEFGRPLRVQAWVGSRRFDVHPSGELRRLKTRAAMRLTGSAIDETLALDEGAVPYSNALDEPEASPWTVGNKRVLYIRVDFSDDPGEPLTVASAQAVITELDRYYRAASFNLTSITGTVTPTVLRMPRLVAGGLERGQEDLE